MSKQKLPTDINVLADTIEQLVSEGLNQQQVAMSLGITSGHLTKMKAAHDRIKQAIVRGRELFVKDLPKAVQDSIIKQIQGYEYTEVEDLYSVQIIDGEEVEVLTARRKHKKYAKPVPSITRYAAQAILTDWEDPEEIKEEKSELQEQLMEVKKDGKLVALIKQRLSEAIKNRGK